MVGERVRIKVLFFAKARELSGVKEANLEVDSSTTYSSLLNRISSTFDLDSIKVTLNIAINHELYTSDCEEVKFTLKPDDEIAVIPPLSGVCRRPPSFVIMDHVKLVNSKLSVEEISNMVINPSCGAVSLFVGTTRDNFQNEKVLQLEYEAYEPMALKAMNEICGEVRQKWPEIENIAICHRLGIVPVAEASVVIAVSSPHRIESLDAVSYTINALKGSVPIWKKEIYESNKDAEWKQNKEFIPNLLKRKKPNENPSSERESSTRSCAPESLPSIKSFSGYDPDMVQINVDTKEVSRRIQSFIERKREEVNASNLQDFCFHGSSVVPRENSCARVDAFVKRRMDSKGHLKIHRVCNKWGPQTQQMASFTVTNPYNSSPSPSQQQEPLQSVEGNSPVIERLKNAEQHLKLNGPVPKDVYSRIKRIEERILFLEGQSPEYTTPAGTKPVSKPKSAPKAKSQMPAVDVVAVREELQARLQRLKNKFQGSMKKL